MFGITAQSQDPKSKHWTVLLEVYCGAIPFTYYEGHSWLERQECKEIKHVCLDAYR